jgi:broad specificity phosphatase PhoE
VTHGLTDLGQQQAVKAVELLAALPIERAVFLTSDYTRARETAAIASVRLLAFASAHPSTRCYCLAGGGSID